MGRDPDKRWNHNLHHHPLVLAAAPTPCRRALDVGCGEGMLTRELLGVADEAVGIDLDEPSIELARATTSDPRASYLRGDVLTHPFEPASFDLIGSVTVLHHLDAEAGLRRMADLLRPGGSLVVIGVARATYPQDLWRDAVGFVATRAISRGRKPWEHSAPIVWPPPLTFPETRAIAERVLPGVAYRRHVLWRYSLTWTKPTDDPRPPDPSAGS